MLFKHQHQLCHSLQLSSIMNHAFHYNEPYIAGLAMHPVSAQSCIYRTCTAMGLSRVQYRP